MSYLLPSSRNLANNTTYKTTTTPAGTRVKIQVPVNCWQIDNIGEGASFQNSKIILAK
jgi:hypothetical protein